MTVRGPTEFQITGRMWQALILSLSVFIIILTIWCLTHGITTIFMHLYYFPIVLIAYHYRWKGFGLATLLALVYLGLVLVLDTGQPDVILGAGYRFLVFVGIAAVIAYLSGRLALEKRSAQESTEIRERYLSLAPAIILALDRNGAITYLNRNGGEILECKPEEVTGISWFNHFLPEKDRKRVKEVYSQLMAGQAGPNRVVENPVLTRGGTEKIIRWYNTVLHDEGGAVAGTLGYGADITDEKRAQDSLRKMQQFQESVITNANVWISVLTRNGTLRIWNEAAEVISGYKKSGVVGKNTVWKQLYPDDEYRKKVTREIQRIIKRDTYLENFETVIRCADGSSKTIVWNTRGLKDSDGAITSYIAIGRDVSAQKSAEFRAGESSRFLAAMIDTLPVPIFFKDAEGKYLGCNPPFEESIGIKRDQIVGKSVYDLSPEDLADKYAAADRQLFENRVPQRYETQVQYADGSRHEVIFYKAPFFNNDGTLGGLIGTFLDITDQKQAKEALRESEERYRNVLENVPDLILVHRNGIILYANPSVTEVMGYAHDELINKQITDFIVPEYYPLIAQATTMRMDGKIIEPYEIEILTKAGKRLTVTVRGSLIDFNGTPASLNVLTDVTERKRAEETLQESQRMLTEVMDLAHLVNWEYDVGTGIFTFDDRFYAMYGTTAEREGGYQMPAEVYAREFIPPEDRGIVAEESGKAIRTTDPHYTAQAEHRIIRRDGEIRHVLVRIGITKDAEGKTIRTHGGNQDITERKKAEEALRESEAYIKTVMDSLPVGVAVNSVDPTVSFTYMNDNFVRFYRTTREALARPDGFWEAVYEDPSLRETNKKKVLDDCASGDPERMNWPDIPITRKGEETTFVTAKNVPVPDKNIMISTVWDVTDRKRAEEEIKRSIDRFRMVMDSIDALVYVADMQTYELLFTNKYAKDAWGDDIEGNICWQVIQSGQSGPCPFCTNNRLVDDKGEPTGIYNWEFRNTANGRWYDCRDSAIRWLDGHLVRLEIATDITERRGIEEALRESRQLFSDIISFLPDPTFVIDNDGKVLAWNRAFEQVSGIPAADMIGKGDHEYSIWQYGKRRSVLIDLVLHPDQDYSRMGYTEIRVEGHTVVAQTMLNRPEGRILTFSLVASPLYDTGGNIIGAIETMRDITRLKETEADLARLNTGLEEMVRDRTKALEDEVSVRKQAEAVIRASLDEKVLLLREIHHRVNNNLQIIISLTKLQIRTLEDPWMTQVLAEIQNRVRAMSLVHEKLYQSESLSSIDLYDYTRFLATHLFSSYGVDHRRVALRIEIGKIPLDIDTAIPLGLILNELISNTLRHAFPDNRSGTLGISSHLRDGLITLVIKDDGPGLKPGFDWKETESLGFRLINSLVDQLGGTIEKGPDPGTMFIITLPSKSTGGSTT